IGGVLMGIVGDFWGRRYALLLSILLFSLPIALNVVIQNVYLLYAIWFLIGFGVNGDNGLSYVYAVELSPPESRGLVGSIMQGLYDIGALLGALLSAIHNVRLYFIIISVLALSSLGLWFLIPESRVRTSFKPSKIFKGELSKVTILGSIFAIGSFLFLVPLVSLTDNFLKEQDVPNPFIILAVMFIVGFILFTIAGRISDRLGRKRTTIAFTVLGVISSLLFLTFYSVRYVSLLTYPVFYVLVLLMVSSSFFAYFGVWMGEIYTMDVRATGTNMTLFLGRLIGGGFGTTIILLLPFGLPKDLGIVLIVSSITVLLSSLGLPETV
ncbi:MAG: MFS transporter, partial [Sulfolobus sp.]|nr:MFS transporter [Sulfolobus sp.]